MSKYRNSSPQLKRPLIVTDEALETTLVFHQSTARTDPNSLSPSTPMPFIRGLVFVALGAVLAAPGAAFPARANERAPISHVETQAMTPTIRSVELPNRVKLQYVEQGDPAGVPVLFLHGVTDSWRSFERVFPHLPASIHVFALTQRGHGDADRPATGYRTRDFAADVAAFMDALGLEQAIVVGHAMGSTNALRFAIDYPERTLGLVLGGSFATYRSNPVVVEFWETAISPLTDPIDPGLARNFQQSTLGQPVPATFFDTAVQESLKVPAHVWRAAFQGFLEDDFADELGRIKAPTLIIWGARDTLCPRADQEALLAEINGARLAVYERAGHALHWEEPERFAAEVVAFAESLVGLDRPGTVPTPRSPVPAQSGAHDQSILTAR